MKGNEDNMSREAKREEQKALGKKRRREERIITIIMFGVIAPLILLFQHYYQDIISWISGHISHFVNYLLDLFDKSSTM